MRRLLNRRIPIALLCLSSALVSTGARAADVLVAVAANFAPVAAELKANFERATDHRIRLASGSTGKLYAQILNGAPFDILLAADQERPERLEREGYGVAGTRFTYVEGRLAVWIPAAEALDASSVAGWLKRCDRVSLANPDLAPYGQAAIETLTRLGALDSLRPRLATGENVAQAYAMVASGAAQAGLVAWSHVIERGNEAASWLVPADYHRAIRQDGVLLRHGAENEGAKAFLAFLAGSEARTLIRDQGYPDGV